MKKINILTLTALLLLPFAIYQSYIQYPLVAELTALISLLFASFDNQKITSRFQHISLPIIAVVLGFIVEYASGGLPLTAIAIFVAIVGLIGRMVFIKFFSYARFPYFEIISTLTVMLLIVTKLLIDINLWIYYFPVYIIFLILAMHTYIIVKNAKMLGKAAKSGYNVQAGVKAPDFLLPDQFGNGVRLSDYYGKRNVLLIFVRGDWCPYCHMIMRTYMRESVRFKEKNIMLMAIGPDPVGINREMAKKLGLDYEVLYDDKMKIAHDYGIRIPDFSLPSATVHEEGMPLPASFLIDKEGNVVYTSRTDHVGEFLDPNLIFPILDSLNK